MGFVLLLFRRKSNESILRWAIVLLLVPIGTYILMYVTSALFFAPAPPPDAKAAADQYHEITGFVSTASYPMLVMFNTAFGIPIRYSGLLYEMRPAKVLGMFLFGLYTYRAGILQNITAHKSLLKKILLFGLMLGVSGNLVLTILAPMGVYSPPSALGVAQAAGYSLGVHALALCYVAALALVWNSGGFGKAALSLFAPAGRMALTNYLMQSVICCLIFYGYGFRQFGKVSLTTAMLIVLTIYVSQIIFSHIWLRFFRYGPMEWVWRRLTYGKKIPFLKAKTD